MSSTRNLVSMALVGTLATSLSVFAAETKPAKKAATVKKTAAVSTPKLSVAEPIKDFGTVPKGSMLDWSFTVKNDGKSDLQILSVQPGCGCTVADFDKVIKPGASGKVTAHVDTKQFSGPISKAVTIQTNDADAPTMQLTIQAIVKPYVEAFPAGFLRFNVLQGDVDTKTFTVYSEEEAPFEITKVEVPGEYVKVNYSKIEKAEDRVQAGRLNQNQYKVSVTFGGPSTTIGPVAEKVMLFTNSKFQPEYQVSLTGVVRPRYTVAPSILNFGEVAPGDDSATRTILLQTMNKITPADFKVTRVESSLPNLVSAQSRMLSDPGKYEVIVVVKDKAAAGELDGKLTIYTNDSLNPTVTVPLKGVVKAAGPAVSK